MDFKTLYLLSIVDKFGHGLDSAFWFCLVVSGLKAAAFFIKRLITVHPPDRRSSSEEDAETLRGIDARLFSRWSLSFFCVSMLFMLLSAAIPSRRDIVEAYAMIEGSKILTAQNGEAVAKEVGLKFDRFLSIIAKSWGEEAPKTSEPAKDPVTPLTPSPVPGK